MRGGSSKGAYFLADDLPADPDERNDLLLRVMGSPDDRQIDGIGGAHPLTSKVAVVSPSTDHEGGIDYLFLQVVVNEAVVSAKQNCGNILAGVGPFAIERGIVSPARATGETDTTVRILMRNSNSVANATLPLIDGLPRYDGNAAISGVPGTGAAIRLDFEDLAGGTCGSLLPTGSPIDEVDGVPLTCIDNGMPVVVIEAARLDISGYETCAELEANETLRDRLEAIRLQVGPEMNLGDVTDATVPKMTLIAPPRVGGSLSTRTFIPHRCHDAIGVLAAVSVATAAMLPDAPASQVLAGTTPSEVMTLEHPTGTFEAALTIDHTTNPPNIERAGIIRTARKLMDGTVYPRP